MKPKTYIHILINSFTKPLYYKEILKTSFWFSFRYFVISIIFLGIASAVLFNIFELPKIEKNIKDNLITLEKNYPEDLSIKWTGDKLETNYDSLEIPSPDLFNEYIETFPSSFATIISNETSSEEIIKKEPESLLILTPTKLYSQTISNNWQSIPLSEAFVDIVPFTLTKDYLKNNHAEIEKFINKNVIQAISRTNYIFAPIFMLISSIWVSLMNSLIALLMMRINGANISFKKTWQLSLHITIIAEAINQISPVIQNFSGINPANKLPMFTISYWIIFLFIQSYIKINRRKR